MTRAESFALFVPRCLGVQDPARCAALGQVAAQLEAAQGWPARDEAGIAQLLRAAQAGTDLSRARGQVGPTPQVEDPQGGGCVRAPA